MVRIYNAKNIITAQFLKNMLAEKGIETYVQNSTSEVAGHNMSGFGIYGVDIYSTEENAEKAINLIKEYNESVK